MRKILVEPSVGIGNLKLGMTSTEFKNTLLQMRKLWSNPNDKTPDICLRSELDDPHWITGRYSDEHSFFLVQYYNDKAVEIGVNHELSQTIPIMLDDIDVFALPAEEIVCKLKQKSRVLCDLPDEQLATNYEFPELGIRLWRESAFHPKLLKDENWMKDMQLVLDEEYQYLYFGLVAVHSRNLFD